MRIVLASLLLSGALAWSASVYAQEPTLTLSFGPKRARSPRPSFWHGPTQRRCTSQPTSPTTGP